MDNNEPTQSNPYAPPIASLEDDHTEAAGIFNPAGSKVPAGHSLEWISAAWGDYMRSFGAWTGLSALYLLLSMVVSCIPIGNQILLCMLAGGFLIGCQRFQDTGVIEVGDLFAGFQSAGSGLAITGLIQAGIYYVFFVPGFVLQMAASLGHAAPQLIVGATIVYYLLAFIGSFVLKLTIFAPALVVFHNMEPLSAVKTSVSVCFKNFGAFIIFVILSYLMLACGFMCCLIGLIFVMPIYIPAYYHAYREIFLSLETAGLNE